MLCSSGMGTEPDYLSRNVKIPHNITYSSPLLSFFFFSCIFIYFASLLCWRLRTQEKKNLGRNKKGVMWSCVTKMNK